MNPKTTLNVGHTPLLCEEHTQANNVASLSFIRSMLGPQEEKSVTIVTTLGPWRKVFIREANKKPDSQTFGGQSDCLEHPEFNPQHPLIFFLKPGIVAHACNVLCLASKTRYIPGAHWSASPTYLASSSVMRNPVLGWGWGAEEA